MVGCFEKSNGHKHNWHCKCRVFLFCTAQLLWTVQWDNRGEQSFFRYWIWPKLPACGDFQQLQTSCNDVQGQKLKELSPPILTPKLINVLASSETVGNYFSALLWTVHGIRKAVPLICHIRISACFFWVIWLAYSSETCFWSITKQTNWNYAIPYQGPFVFFLQGRGPTVLVGFEGGMQKNWLLRGAIYTKKTREKERGHVKYLRKTLKSHNILIQKCFTTNLVDRITI